MLKAFVVKYKRLLFVCALFLSLLLLYFALSKSLAVYWQMSVQGETITAKHLAETVVWLAAWWVATILIDVIVWENIVYKRTGNPIPRLLKNTVSLLILLLIIILIVAVVYHKSITGLLATTGALGIVVGLSLRGVIENAVQGVALNIERPFKTGDWITIPGKVDELSMVKDITYRNTYIEDTYGHILAIPNSVVCSNVVMNFSRANSQLFSVNFTMQVGVRGMDTQDVLRVLRAVVSTQDFIAATPAPQVCVAEIGSVDIKYTISVWVYRNKSNPTDARHLLNEQIISQLFAAGFIVGRPYIDHDGIEQQLATILQEVSAFDALSGEDKKTFYHYELSDKRSLRVLQHVRLLSTLNKEELISLSEHITICHYKAGEMLIKQGDQGDKMYVLVEGALQVLLNAPDGKELISVATLAPPDFFGELSVLIGDPRSATVVAISDVELYEISRDTMSHLFELHPDIIEKISEKIVEQKMVNLQKINEYSTREAIHEKKRFVAEFVNKIKQFFSKKAQ